MPKKTVTTKTVKPQRGYKPGVRGPAMTPAEREAERLGANKVIVVDTTPLPNRNLSGLRQGQTPYDPQVIGKQRKKLARQLSDLIREIGAETVDAQKGWTRLEAVVRRLYTDAMSGKTPAQALLFERGWGRVPTPVQLDIRSELLDLMAKTGLTQSELELDPVLKELMANVVEGTFANAGTDRTAE